MSFRRPCRICYRWFAPDPKVGNRQHVCGDPACRTEAHRRAGARCRRKGAAFAQRKRLATRLIRLLPKMIPMPRTPIASGGLTGRGAW